jgi:hypothetical protein
VARPATTNHPASPLVLRERKVGIARADTPAVLPPPDQLKPPPPATPPLIVPAPETRAPQPPPPAAVKEPVPLPRPSGTTGRSEPPAAIIGPQPIRQVKPAVPASALKMLSKDLVVSVQLRIDASGNVVDAAYRPPAGTFGKYFAERALTAARLWKFEPAKVGTQNVPSDTVLEFRFSPPGH